MNRKRKKPLDFEPLEGKQLLTTLHHAAVRPHAAANVATQNFSLAGTLHTALATIQTFTANNQNYGTFSFTGKVKSMGAIHGAFVAAVDSSQQYMSTGMMRFISKKGTVDLALSPAPGDKSSYLFTVSSGTGAYTGATGSGRIQTHSYGHNLSSVTFSVSMNPS